MNWKDARLQIVLLALVFAGAMTHYIAGVALAIHQETNLGTQAAYPFITNSQGHLTRITPEAKAAGLLPGDLITSINGQPYNGRVDSYDAVNPAKVRDTLVVGIMRPDGTSRQAEIKLAANVRVGSKAARWAFLIIVVMGLPLFCILVGTWVVAARPRLLNAWLIFGILLLFPAGLLIVHGYTRPLIYFLPYWSDGVTEGSFLALMLFGLYFPQRSSVDLRAPWLKWVLGIPLIGLIPFDFADEYAHNLNRTAFAWLANISTPQNYVETGVAIACVGVFIWALSCNVSGATTPDARRRLGVLLYGAITGMTPLLFIALWGVTHGGNFGTDLPEWLVLVCLGIAFLFPITLAYVVVVQRAMDVRILLRQGTQYALARGTLNGVRMVLYVLLGLAVFNGFKHHFERTSDVVALAAIIFVLLVFRYRFADRISASLDRRFFRESYSVELMLAELSDEARGFTETDPLLKTITHRLAETLHIDRIAVLLRNGHTFALQQAVGLNGAIPVPVVLADNSQTIRNLNREHRPATIFHDNPDGWLFLATEQERRLLRELESEVLLPLPGRHKLVGLISLGPKRSEEPYSRADLQMLQSVAMQTGMAIENTELIGSLAREASQRERLNREIEIAREVQERLLPQTFPQLQGLECSGICRPAQGVGGDYYDFIVMENGRLGIAIGDVSGKGISAALLMAGLRASLRAVTLSGAEADLSAVMRNVNLLVFEASADNRYATFFFGIYDPATRVLDYVNAGHNAPFVIRPLNKQPPTPTNGGHCSLVSDCQVLRLEEGGPVIGLLQGAHYSNARVLVTPGDVLVAFTDGISEAMNRRDDEWGEDRLIEAACKCTQKSACEIVRCLVDEADAFTDGAPQHDDMTVAVLKVA